MASTSYSISGFGDIGQNFKAAPGAGYTPGAVGYKDSNSDLGNNYLRKATSYLSSADALAFPAGAYYTGGVDLSSKFAHAAYRPQGGSSSSMVGPATGSTTGTLAAASYGGAGRLWNVVIAGGGGQGGSYNSPNGSTYWDGGGGGAAVAYITGLNIDGVGYSLGCGGSGGSATDYNSDGHNGTLSRLTSGALQLVANGGGGGKNTYHATGSSGGGVGGTWSISAGWVGGGVNGGAGGVGQAGPGYASTGVAAAGLYTDWSNSPWYTLPGGASTPCYFPPPNQMDGTWGPGGASAFGMGGYGGYYGPPADWGNVSGLGPQGYGAGSGGSGYATVGGHAAPGVMYVFWN